MKICIINNLYPPYSRGGAEIVVKNQVDYFLKQGHDVFVITTRQFRDSVNSAVKTLRRWLALRLFHFRTRSNFYQRTQLGFRYNMEPTRVYRFYPLNIFSFYNINKFSAILRLIWHGIDMLNIYSYFKIKKIFKKEKPDIIYVHNLTGIGYLIPKLIKKLKIRYVQTMHDIVLIYPSGLLIKGQENCFLNRFFLTKLWGKINKYLFDFPDEVRFPSKWLFEFYKDRGFFKKSECKIVKNFSMTEYTEITKLQNHKDMVRFIYIGQIEEHKGILFLIKTINKLQITRLLSPEGEANGGQANYKLQIIGNGTKLEKAKQLAKKNSNIKFYPWESIEKDRKFLKQADYTIVPSLCYENSPTIIFESLRAGVPVIASNLGGIPELVKNNVNGYLFEAGDEDSLIKVLKSVRFTK